MSSVDFSHLSDFQKNITKEALEKNSGSLWIPMGSGKTAMSLTMALYYREECKNKRPSLIVVSKSLISEWTKEISRIFGEDFPFHVIHHEGYCSDVINCDVSRFQMVITTPEVISKHYKHYRIETKVIDYVDNILYYKRPNNPITDKTRGTNPIYGTRWSSYFIDEANDYLNLGTQRTKSLVSVCSKHRWLLSGTMFSEPKIGNLFGYLTLLNDPFTPRNMPAFKSMYSSGRYEGVKRTVVTRDINEDYIPSELGQNVHNVIASHNLSKNEADFFLKIKKVINVLYERLNEIGGLEDPVLKEEAKTLRGMILGMITYIRESLICPLIPISSMVMKMSNLETRNRVVRSFITELVNLNSDWLEDVNSVYSSRLRKIVEIINDHKNEKIVIFSSFRTVLDVLKNYIPEERNVFSICSNQSPSKRSDNISEWGNSESGILLLTYGLGSCGLNLQKGSVVIVSDYGWNVDITNQAVARIIRRGQENTDIFVYYLTSNTGVENALYDIHKSKSIMSKEIMNGKMDSFKKKMKLNDILKLINMEDNHKILDSFYIKK